METTSINYHQWHKENKVLDYAAYDAFIHYLDNEHSGMNDAYDASVVERFENDWLGQWDSFLDFVTEKFNDSNDIPTHLESYIDYKAIERDWVHNYWVSVEGHVFINS